MPIPDNFDAEEIETVFDTLLDEMYNADLGEAFASIMPMINEALALNFSLAVGPDGSPWAPHAPSTVRRYGPHPLLILSGAMLAAVSDQGGSGHIEDILGREAKIGADGGTIPYLFTHEYGYGDIPARPFFYLVDATVESVEDAFFNSAYEIIIGPD